VDKDFNSAAQQTSDPMKTDSTGQAFAGTADEPAPSQIKSQDTIDAALPFTNAEDLL